MVIFTSLERLLGILAERIPNAFYFLWCLLSRDAHDLHKLGGHFRRYLILNAARSVRICLKKSQDLFLGYTRAFQSVEKLAVPDMAAQLLRAGQEFLTVRAYP